MKACQFCAEDIQDEALKCRHCGEWVVVNHGDPGVDNSASEIEIAKSRQSTSSSDEQERTFVEPLSSTPSLATESENMPTLFDQIFDKMFYVAAAIGLMLGLFKGMGILGAILLGMGHVAIPVLISLVLATPISLIASIAIDKSFSTVFKPCFTVTFILFEIIIAILGIVRG